MIKLTTLALTSLLAVQGLTGCGIPTSDKPTAVNLEGVDQANLMGLEPPEPLNTQYQGRLYLLDEDNNLLVATRSFPSEPSASDILESLAKAPLVTEFEDYGFVKTELPPDLEPRIAKTDIESSSITISVNDQASLREIAQSDPLRSTSIYGQIVCSLNFFRFVNSNSTTIGVIIEDSDGPIFATDSKTASIRGPARPTHFNNCTPGIPVP